MLRSNSNQVLLLLEYISALIPITELRKIVDALIQDKSFADCKTLLKKSTLDSLAQNEEALIAEIFSTTQKAPPVKRAGFNQQLEKFIASLPSVATSEVFSRTMQPTPASRPTHEDDWLEFEKAHYINNNRIGGNRLSRIDNYARSRNTLNQSYKWFLGQIYNDQLCLSNIQKEALSQAHPEVLTIQPEPAQSIITLLPSGARKRQPVNRLGVFTDLTNFDDDDNEDEEEIAYITAPAKKSRTSEKIKEENDTNDSLVKYTLDTIQPQLANISNTAALYRETVHHNDGHNYLKNIISIPPQNPNNSEAENYQLGLKILQYLQKKFSNRSAINIIVQPPKDQRNSEWRETNTFRNKKNEVVGLTLSDDHPTGTVAIRSSTCCRLKERFRGLREETNDESNDSSETQSPQPTSLSLNHSTLFAAPVVKKPLPSLSDMMTYFKRKISTTTASDTATASTSTRNFNGQY